MKVSTRAHYGIRMLTELAHAYGGGPLSLSEIAETEGLPLAYLEQLVSPLRRAGLVESTRGAHGGYQLARDPSTITFGEVMQVLEGPFEPVECTAGSYVSGTCAREPACVSKVVWHRLKSSMEAALDRITLADLSSDPHADVLVSLPFVGQSHIEEENCLVQQ